MPPVALPASELDQLLAFLAAQVAPPRGPAAPRPALLDHFAAEPLEPGPAAGAAWARRLGCVGCHRLGESDPGVPDLRHVAWIATDEELRASLLEPQRRFPGSAMPPLHVPPDVEASLLEYLALLRAPLPSSPAAVFREVCARCHGRQRDPKSVVLARRPPLLEAGAISLPRDRFVRAVLEGRKGTAMRAWGRVFTPAFAEALYQELRRAP